MLPGRTSARQTVFADRSLSLLPSLPPSNPASLFLSLSVVLGRRRGRVTVHACCGGSQGRYSRNKVQIVNPTRSHCSPGGAGSRAVRFKLPMMPRRPGSQVGLVAATVTGTGHDAGPGDRLTLNVKARCRGQGPGPTVTVRRTFQVWLPPRTRRSCIAQGPGPGSFLTVVKL
jgi:hypothetical protein